MARGWESKSVEEQVQLAQKSERKVSGGAHKRTPEQLEMERKRDSILLQRRRVMRDIENCNSERYRQTLECGLAYLDSQLALLEADAS